MPKRWRLSSSDMYDQRSRALCRVICNFQIANILHFIKCHEPVSSAFRESHSRWPNNSVMSLMALKAKLHASFHIKKLLWMVEDEIRMDWIRIRRVLDRSWNALKWRRISIKIDLFWQLIFISANFKIDWVIKITIWRLVFVVTRNIRLHDLW